MKKTIFLILCILCSLGAMAQKKLGFNVSLSLISKGVFLLIPINPITLSPLSYNLI